MNRHIDVNEGEKASTQSVSAEDACLLKVVVDQDEKNGETLFENIALNSGLRMIVGNYVVPRRFRMAYEVERAPLTFCYNLSQRMRVTINSCDRNEQVVQRSPGDGAIAYLPKTRGMVESQGGRISGVSLHFSIPAFGELFDKIPECLKKLDIVHCGATRERRLFQQSPFNGDTFLVLKQILECPYKGELRRLFFEAKSLELVALKLSELENEDKKNASILTHQDLERVHEARCTLLARLEDPPSLTALSRLAGINRNKLNHGFKQLYGKTAFNVLRDARLSKARTLLQQSDLNLAEVAFSVGYNSQANFTKAFQRHFGQTPKTVRRQGMVGGSLETG